MIRLGVMGCANVAYKGFMPAAKTIEDIDVVCVAEQAFSQKLTTWLDRFPMETEPGFDALIARDDIDALYIPQIPSLHYELAKKAIEAGKHVLIETPATTSYECSKELVELARAKGVALHENYVFPYHAQIDVIRDMVESNAVGNVRLVRGDFGLARRLPNDFRYDKSLGGGALLDVAGYPVKLAALLLGESVKVDISAVSYQDGVDMYGCATLSNDDGVVMQIGFGLDSESRSTIDVWGSEGRIIANRVYVVPEDAEPIVTIETAEFKRDVIIPSDNCFKHSIEAFVKEIESEDAREESYKAILTQARLIDEIRAKSI